MHKSIKSIAYGALATLYTTVPVWADDTDIFFGGTASLYAKPNVLFILDSSGSMDSNTAGGSQKRMDALKESMRAILTRAQGINAGLMNFTNPGGPVLYPVKDLDEVVSSLDLISGVSVSSVSYASDDAAQRTSSEVVVSDKFLALMKRTGGTETKQISTAISASNDDGYEVSSNNDKGFVSTEKSAIWLNRRSNWYHTAMLRFQNVEIPQGAIINESTIDFRVKSRGEDDGTLRIDIYGEKATDSSPYVTGAKKYSVSGRAKTNAKVDWNMGSGNYNPSANNTFTAPYRYYGDTDSNLNAIVQEIVSQSGWAEGNSMAFMFQRDNSTSDRYRYLESYDSGYPPQLNVEYQHNIPAQENSLVALRFNNVKVPQGADVTSATITMKSASDSVAGGFLKFEIEASDNSEAFSESNSHLSLRPRTGVSVDSAILTSWSDGESYTSPDLSSVVESVTDRAGWCGGNSLTIFVTGTNAEKVIHSYESVGADALSLDVRYDKTTVPSNACQSHVFERAIAIPEDDVEERGSTLYEKDPILQLGQSAGIAQTTGLIFNDLRLKNNASLDEAYIEFAVAEGSPDLPAALTISIENSGNAEAYSASTLPSNRLSVGSVSWNVSAGWNKTAEIYRTPDISSLLEKVTQHISWSPGNRVAISIAGTGSLKASSNDGSTLAPKLVIKANHDQYDSLGDTVRYRLMAEVNRLVSAGWTPAVPVYHEAARYYKGLPVNYGLNRGNSGNPSNNLARVSHPDTYVGGTLSRPNGCTEANLDAAACANEKILLTPSAPLYKSPITEACQKNYIVMLTDGLPNKNTTADRSAIIDMIPGVDSCKEYTLSSNSNFKHGGTCAPELAKYLSNEDQSGLAGTQTIQTYTIGFNNENNWIKDIPKAENGNGAYFAAQTSTQLTDVFDKIIKSIKAANASFTQPSITVNQLDRLSHREDVYYSVFKPVELQKWQGNLKKYRLDGKTGVLVDADNAPAIDPATGYFSHNAKSFWSAEKDGYKVQLGGAASKLPHPNELNRKLFTYTGTYPVAGAAGAFSNTANQFKESNSALTKELLGIPGAQDDVRTQLIRWARGENEARGGRFEMGDPLHSEPVLMTYSVNKVNNTTESTVYIATNEGYLHAIDANTGVEQFAFIPKELLENLKDFKTNAPVVGGRVYGLDGGLTLIANDQNSDLDYADSDDYVWLYAGMRRGGRNYYALDVTSTSAPKLKWVIKGGSGGTTGFEELGQTWSKPIEIDIKFDGSRKKLLLFAGGYDEAQDTKVLRTGDSMGRAIYMVDPDTGALFWSAGLTNTHDLQLTDMKYSIPSDIKTIDMDLDGLADQLYVGDMGGQIWRFDIHNGVNAKSDLATGGVIADLGTATAAGNRRFYYEPDLSYSVEGANKVLAIGIGSGWRANPLNEVVVDRYYLIKQFSGIFSALPSYTKLSESDLYDATQNLITAGDAIEKEEAEKGLSNGADRTAEGWYITLERPGEKVLANSLTANGEITFTTYEPEPPDSIKCLPVQGTARAYIVKILTAEPLRDLSGDGNLTKIDREVRLDQGGIPASPKIIDPDTGAPVILIGPEILEEGDTGRQIRKTYWRETQQ